MATYGEVYSGGRFIPITTPPAPFPEPGPVLRAAAAYVAGTDAAGCMVDLARRIERSRWGSDFQRYDYARSQLRIARSLRVKWSVDERAAVDAAIERLPA